jgi:tripartite-type tricarboxylate transporter receptor subunit TctC
MFRNWIPAYAGMTRALAFAGMTLFFAATNAFAQSYPTKPIKIVVPFTPGGFNDTLGRTIANHLQAVWGQTVVVDNKPGGNTTIGTDAVAKAAPDGYTLLIIGFPFPVTPLLMKDVPYDVLKDFTPIIIAAGTPNLLVVNPSVPAKSVRELIAIAKAQPGSINYASTGSGTSNHISMELFKLMTGTNITHVPYKGSGPAVTDLLGGQVQVMFDNVPNVLQHVKAGKLRALGVTGLKRSPLAPDIPTVDESGVPGFEVSVFFGLAAPAGTPREIVDKLNAEVTKMLALPDVKQRFLAQGVETVGTTPAEAAEYVRGQRAKWAKVVAESGAKID